MRTVIKPSALMLTAIILAGCGAHGNLLSKPSPRDVSDAHNISAGGATGGVPPDTTGVRHGEEIESGVPFMVTDGHVHVGFTGSTTITRTADGVIVTNHGQTRTFSSAAIVTQSGSYHIYAPIAH
jgi:predicted small lipoprotein YifL